MSLTRRSLLAGGALAGAGLLTGCASTGTTSSATPSEVTGSPLPSATALQISAAELVPLALFNWDGFNGEALFALGGASSQTSEVGEMIRIVQTINNATGNPAAPDTPAFDAYVDAFTSFANQLGTLADQVAAKNPVSARTRYLRASTYATQALFFILGSSRGVQEQQAFELVENYWNKAVSLMTPKVEQFQVSSDYGPIPGYFLSPDSSGSRKPTLIISSGSDGQNVESMQFGVTAGLQRGYNIVLFEGPGQMTPLFVRNTVFTPNWDQVVGPVLEWTKQRSDVGKIGLVGISFGGMLCARAAAKLTGLSAVVLEPAAYNAIDLWHDTEAVTAVKKALAGSPADQAAAKTQVNQVMSAAFPHLPRTTQFMIYKRGSIYTTTTQTDARANRAPTDYYDLLATMASYDFLADFGQLKIPTMITENEGDQFFQDQGAAAYAALTNVPPQDKLLLPLTAAQGAQLHDQPTGPQVAQEYIFDWLASYLT